MSDHDHGPTIAGGAADDEAVASLLRLAGPREPVPAERMQRLKASVHAEWRAQVAARRRQRLVAWSLGGLAAAAVLALVARATVGSGPAAPAVVEFATIEAVGVAARLTSDAVSGASEVRAGDRLAVGHTTLQLDVATARLRLPGGATVVLAGGSTVELITADVVGLVRGAVYIDSSGRSSLEVRTRLGVVRDVGTRFEVRLTPRDLQVRVRDGAVQVRRGRERHDGKRGEQIVLDAAGMLARTAIPIDGPTWAWTSGAGPFELEGRSLREFLEWITGENGWQLEFADAVVEDKARTTILHGTIHGLTSEQALVAVLATSGVEHRLAAGVLSIQLVEGLKD